MSMGHRCQRWGALTGAARDEAMKTERMATAAEKKRIVRSGLEDKRRRGWNLWESCVGWGELNPRVLIYDLAAVPRPLCVPVLSHLRVISASKEHDPDRLPSTLFRERTFGVNVNPLPSLACVVVEALHSFLAIQSTFSFRVLPAFQKMQESVVGLTAYWR